MQGLSALCVLLLLHQRVVSGFPAVRDRRRGAAATVVAREASKSKSVPFLEQPSALTGTLPGDVGFDPLNLSGQWSDKDWSEQIWPDRWKYEGKRIPISTIEWMREAELKHSRVAMLATLGWLAADAGIRFPFSIFQVSSVTNSRLAHDSAVSNGSLWLLLFTAGILEVASAAAIVDQAKGSGRRAGDFGFDPLGLSRDKYKAQRYAESEIKNGRLAMIAFGGNYAPRLALSYHMTAFNIIISYRATRCASRTRAGIVTQSVLFPDQYLWSF
jgi:Chlorophyll A-B binding protein